LEVPFSTKDHSIQVQHNNFQEYLAAKMLNKDFKIIKKYISYYELPSVIRWVKKALDHNITNVIFEIIDNFRGSKIYSIKDRLYEFLSYKEINPSWVNTISFLCQIREENDLLNYIKKKYPEIALKFEIEIKDEKTINNFFKAVFKKYTTDKKIWIDRENVDLNVFANFARTNEIYNYLLGYAKKNKYFIFKYNAIQLLGRMEDYAPKAKELKNLLIEYAKNENENTNVRHISLYSIERLNFNDSETIEQLLELKNSDKESVLAGFYNLISQSENLDDYLYILLEGIKKEKPVLSERMELMDVKINIANGLERVKSIKGIKEMISYFRKNPKNLEEFHVRESLNKIIDNIVEVYRNEKSIYNDMKNIIELTEKKSLKRTTPIIRKFFKKTDTTLKLFREILDNERINYGVLGYIANKKCVDFMIEEYKKNILNDDQIWIFLNRLMTRNKNYDEFKKQILEKTVKVEQIKKDYSDIRERERKKTVEIIFDKKELIKEIEKFFEELDKESIYFKIIESEEEKIEEKVNPFVFKLIYNILREDESKKWPLKEIIKEINSWKYDEFSVNEIFKLLKHQEKIELLPRQKKVIKDYCMEQIENVDFANAFCSNGRQYKTEKLAEKLWFFMRNYNFDYPENILLDMISYDWIENNRFVGIEYIENKLPREKIRRRVINNLENGITKEQILKNHILFCNKYKVVEAKEFLYDIVKNDIYNGGIKKIAIDTLGELSGTISILEELLDFTNENANGKRGFNSFIRIARILITKKNSDYCKKRLLKNLKSKNSKKELLKIESAKLLIKERQDKKAIKFYIKNYKNNIIKDSMTYFEPLEKIDTPYAISIMIKLLEYELKNNEDGYLIAKIREVLKNIARNGSYRRVNKNIKKFIKNNNKKYPEVNFLNITIDNIKKENLINKSKHKKKLKDVIGEIDKMVE